MRLEGILIIAICIVIIIYILIVIPTIKKDYPHCFDLFRRKKRRNQIKDEYRTFQDNSRQNYYSREYSIKDNQTPIIYVNKTDSNFDNTTTHALKNKSNPLSHADFNDGISPSEFFELKKVTSGDMVGVYVLLNINKRMFYVGQAKRVFFRVNQHFTGHGNKDVYSDYQYGNTFRIKIIKLRESGYDDIDKLEKDMIAKYDAYNTGYNKTVGNG